MSGTWPQKLNIPEEQQTKKWKKLFLGTRVHTNNSGVQRSYIGNLCLVIDPEVQCGNELNHCRLPLWKEEEVSMEFRFINKIEQLKSISVKSRT